MAPTRSRRKSTVPADALEPGSGSESDPAPDAGPMAAAFALSASPMAVLAADGTLAAANPAFGRFLGAAGEAVLGRELRAVVHPEDRARVLAAIGPLLAGELARCRVEARWLCANGDTTRGVASAVAAAGAVVLQVEEVGGPDRLQALLAGLDRGELRPATAVRWVVGIDGVVRYAAAATAGAMGFDPAGLVGEAWDARVHPDDRTALRALLRRLRDDAGAVARMTARIAGPDGWRRFDLSAASALDDPAVGGIAIDLRRSTEGTAGAPAAADPFAADPAPRPTNRTGPESADVLALVGHEFRTPLTSIRGYSELLAGPVTDPGEVAEFAGIIHQEASRLARLIDDMLLLDQMASRRIRLNLIDTSLNGVVQEVVARLEPEAPGHHFALHLHPELPPVPADRDRLVQVATNLLANAIKYSPAGGEIAIRTERDRKRAILAVRDRGIGIPAHALDRIFERFQRVDSAPNRALGGRGLGLSLVQEIVRLHGGRVWAESSEGSGATFRVALPLQTPAALAAD